MLTSRRLKLGIRLPPVFGLAVLLLTLAACQPIQDPRLLEQGAGETQTSPLLGTPQAGEEAAEDEGIPGVGPAMATISADSLRVRSEPNDTAEVVAGVRSGESYRVIGISSDGEWLQLEIERAPEGQGWVASSFVILEGDITNIPIVEVEGQATEAEATEEATPEATEEVTEEATEEATEEPTEEATAEPTEEATPEPTEEPAEEATLEATPAATEEATEEPTPEPTEEPAEEATPEPTAEAAEEPAEEATPEATEEATEEATPEATEEAAEEEAVEPPPAGFVTVNTDGTPLRVRSSPTTEEDNRVGHVFDGETYRVLEVSEDGLWVRIDVPQLGLPDGGWVSAEFVVMGE